MGIYFVLDRSGSMQSIAADVIEGFNAFVKEQQQLATTDAARMVMTLIQFDSDNPHEVVSSGRGIAEVQPLTSATFQPRSRTPLYDALGKVVSLATSAHKPNERIVVVTFSDGHENASREQSRKSIFNLIQAKREAGWAFVFLGANQDSYAEAGGLGYGSANTQNFHFDKRGVQSAYTAVTAACSSMRMKLSGKSKAGHSEEYDSENFFESSKIAEEDYKSRPSKS